MNINKKSRAKRGLPSLTERRSGHDRARKITWHFLAGLLSCLSLVPVTFGFPQKAKTNDAQAAAAPIAGNVNVITGQGQVNNLAGVTVKLTEPKTGSTLQSTLTDESGRFQFTQLLAGTYTLEVSAEGFKPWVKTIAVGQGPAAAEDVTLAINAVEQQLEVRGETVESSTHSAGARATVINRGSAALPHARLH